MPPTPLDVLVPTIPLHHVWPHARTRAYTVPYLAWDDKTVREATIFGQSIHALVADGDDLADLAGPNVSLRPAAANLEDVFVTIARRRQAELAEAGRP